MKYILMMNCPIDGYETFAAWPKKDLQAHIAFQRRFDQSLRESGELVSAEGLANPHEAKFVRAGKERTPITDGVFPEAKEFLAGYWIVDVPTPQRAYEIAAGASAAPGPGGVPMNMPIEVRQHNGPGAFARQPVPHKPVPESKGAQHMKFILLTGGTQASWDSFSAWPKNDVQAYAAFVDALNKEIGESGELVAAEGLAGPDQAKIVRAGKNGAPITDGIFPEAKEFLAGYWIVDVESPARAYEIAARASAAPGPGGTPMNNPIEVRQIMSGPPEDLL